MSGIPPSRRSSRREIHTLGTFFTILNNLRVRVSFLRLGVSRQDASRSYLKKRERRRRERNEREKERRRRGRRKEQKKGTNRKREENTERERERERERAGQGNMEKGG